MNRVLLVKAKGNRIAMVQRTFVPANNMHQNVP